MSSSDTTGTGQGTDPAEPPRFYGTPLARAPLFHAERSHEYRQKLAELAPSLHGQKSGLNAAEQERSRVASRQLARLCHASVLERLKAGQLSACGRRSAAEAQGITRIPASAWLPLASIEGLDAGLAELYQETWRDIHVWPTAGFTLPEALLAVSVDDEWNVYGRKPSAALPAVASNRKQGQFDGVMWGRLKSLAHAGQISITAIYGTSPASRPVGRDDIAALELRDVIRIAVWLDGEPLADLRVFVAHAGCGPVDAAGQAPTDAWQTFGPPAAVAELNRLLAAGWDAPSVVIPGPPEQFRCRELRQLREAFNKQFRLRHAFVSDAASSEQAAPARPMPTHHPDAEINRLINQLTDPTEVAAIRLLLDELHAHTGPLPTKGEWRKKFRNIPQVRAANLADDAFNIRLWPIMTKANTALSRRGARPKTIGKTR